MSKPPSNTKGHPVLPRDAQPCVWMAAGVVTYKLCDRALDCEQCPLDAALRGRPLTSGHASPQRRAGWVFPADRHYGRTHLWVRALASGVVRLGLDALAAELVASLEAVALPPAAARIIEGQGLVTLAAHAGGVTLRSPIAGRVGCVNARLLDEPMLAVTDPYEEGWLVELDESGTAGALLPATEMRREARLEMQRFRRRVALQLLVGASTVGLAMADGGEGLTELWQMLGRERYLTLVTEALA